MKEFGVFQAMCFGGEKNDDQGVKEVRQLPVFFLQTFDIGATAQHLIMPYEDCEPSG